MEKTLQDVINANEEISKDKEWYFTFNEIKPQEGKKTEIRINLNNLFRIVGAEYGGIKLTEDAGDSTDSANGKMKWIIPGMAPIVAKKTKDKDNFYKLFKTNSKDNKAERIICFKGSKKEETLNVHAGKGAKDTINKIENIFNKFESIIKKEKLKFIFKFGTTNKDDIQKKLLDNIDTAKIFLVETAPSSTTPSTSPDRQGEVPYSAMDNVDKYEPGKTKSFSRNRIIFGAPGTGKSFLANGNANYLLFSDKNELKIDKAKLVIGSINIKDNGKLSKELSRAKTWCMERVTFHPEYSYYDFVGSYKPVMRNVPIKYVDSGRLKTVQAEEKDATERKIEYDFVPGPFARILLKALKDKDHPYLLLIEEINRARVAAVFGDIFQLLDRNDSGASEYEIMTSLELARYLQNNPELKNEEIEPIRIPENLYIWATMNSADQGVYPLDTAFKRRWSMEYIPYNPPEGEILPADEWNQIRIGINKLLLEKGHVNEDKLMGYYFLKEEERADDKLKDALQNKVLMYLFDDAAKHCRKEIFKIEGKDVITFSALQNKMRAAMKQRIDPNSNLGVFSEALQHPAAGNNG